jgi:hypothetical protein
LFRKILICYLAPHRLAAAAFAISLRRFDDNDFALAFPPLLAPSLLSATAA